MRKQRNLLAAVLLAAVTFSLPSWAQAPETAKLRISTLPIAGQVPIFVAQKLGYFKKAGLEVDIQFSDGGAQAVPLLVQGSLQLAVTPITSLALANQQGFNLKLVPPTLDEKKVAPGQTVLMARDDGSVPDIAHLKGKRIGVNTINSVNWMYARALLRHGGLDPAAATFVEIPFPSMVDALMRGSVDAVVLVQPFHHIALSSGKTRVVGYPFVAVQPGMHIASYAGDAKWLSANPNTVQAFVTAMREATDFIAKNPEQAKDMIAEFTKAKRDLVEKVPVDDWSNTVSADDVTKTLDLMRSEGLLKKPMQAGSLIYAR
ncbi:MAG: ABC transporter substrate-binding protein [Pseudolabrys sp.]